MLRLTRVQLRADARGSAVKSVGKPDAGNPQVRFEERERKARRCRMAQATAPSSTLRLLTPQFQAFGPANRQDHRSGQAAPGLVSVAAAVLFWRGAKTST